MLKCLFRDFAERRKRLPKLDTMHGYTAQNAVIGSDATFVASRSSASMNGLWATAAMRMASLAEEERGGRRMRALFCEDRGDERTGIFQ